MKKPTIYLSGPMTGIKDFNYPAFHRAAKWLRECGHIVFNPAETNGGQYDLEHRPTLLRVDVGYIMAADMLCLLPGWEASDGSRFEVLVAMEFGIPVWTVDSEGYPIRKVNKGAVRTIAIHDNQEVA